MSLRGPPGNKDAGTMDPVLKPKVPLQDQLFLVSDVLACLGTILRCSAWEPHGIGLGMLLCLASWHALRRFLLSTVGLS